MTRTGGPDASMDPVEPTPAASIDEQLETGGPAPLAPRWRADPGPSGLAGHRPPAGRRLRAGCWVLVVVLLLICCVLSAWLTDAVLDLRAVTTGG